jgi:hypothetical protein
VRYALSPYIKQMGFIFKALRICVLLPVHFYSYLSLFSKEKYTKEGEHGQG